MSRFDLKEVSQTEALVRPTDWHKLHRPIKELAGCPSNEIHTCSIIIHRSSALNVVKSLRGAETFSVVLKLNFVRVSAKQSEYNSASHGSHFQREINCSANVDLLADGYITTFDEENKSRVTDG